MPGRKSLTDNLDNRSRAGNGKEKETFGCPYPGCGQSYSRMEYLKRHQRKHQDDRPFACKDCSKAFARSDVLLRHRRRCHPTPPPVDVSAHSPPQVHRGYPGMPVSSSRTDPREMSPVRGRKRQTSQGSSDQPALSRRRTEEEDDDEDSDIGETSRFARQNGMGNGGVYVSNYVPESSTYTPHLIPMFQNQPFSNSDPNHLEDASVLLSMAYGGGSMEPVPTVQGQRVVADDWAPASTINMMMDASEPPSNQIVSNPYLPAWGSTWLGEEAKPDNAFLGSMFSPTAFDLSTLAPESQEDVTVTNILDQLSKYEIPQSQHNLNPERPLLRLQHEEIYQLAGAEMYDKTSKFYLPAERFAGCYQIPHWGLPPLRVMSVMANRTFNTVLKHFSMVHTPTFRLIDTAACLAFAICTVGGIKSSSYNWFKNDKISSLLVGSDPDIEAIDGPLPRGEGWQSMYQKNFGILGGDSTSQKVDEWETAHIVRNEKSNMLVKSFGLAKGVLMTEYNVALLQALVLYNAPYFLSEDESERVIANMFLGTIVNIARQVGFFTPELEHFEVEVQRPPELWTGAELDLYWRRWIQLETRRRTAYLIYHLDIVSALESHIPPILTSCEMADMPLPAPDSLWLAADAEEWFEALKKYRYMTLDEAMRRIFYLPTYGAFDKLHERSDTKYYNLLNTTELGPFARTAIISSILRGVIDIGEGKRDRGDWRDLTDLWVNCNWLKPGDKCLDSEGKDLGPVTRESLRDRFSQGLERWRQGWDFDPTCPNPANYPSPSGDGMSEVTKLAYVEEALPFYWLALHLMDILKAAPPHEPGWNAFGINGAQPGGVRYGNILKNARRFTRMGEGSSNVFTNPSRTSVSSINTPNSVASGSSLSAGKIGVGSGSVGMSSTQVPVIPGVDLDAFEAFAGLEGIL
ncbi:hypothetical protein BD324DRAFT_594403 [Kockovaella imperatae]|uniref:C2H2-type domain-containing protein n=1 Tax=Kockovaella imperatae TaxID=4999 RepID=A0A1Y1U976_9TREE|nr:hypothetical protein BD324DRAFT_594403 [Kockovaella imperatae]ORX34579.1 hypothetical protein BD324DRAFT_594403 [Kockovaella imperatae]